MHTTHVLGFPIHLDHLRSPVVAGRSRTAFRRLKRPWGERPLAPVVRLHRPATLSSDEVAHLAAC